MALPGVLRKVSEINRKLYDLGPETAIDVNNVTMRFALDVTGLVGFAKDYMTCSTFDDARTDDLLEVLKKGAMT